MKKSGWAMLSLMVSVLDFTAIADDNETGQTSDAWLKAKIVKTYALSEPLNPFLIDVK